jgi:hypothetical protein
LREKDRNNEPLNNLDKEFMATAYVVGELLGGVAAAAAATDEKFKGRKNVWTS